MPIAVSVLDPHGISKMPLKRARISRSARRVPDRCSQKTTELVTAAGRQGPRRHSGARLLLAWVGVCCGCGTFVTATSINPSPRPLVPRSPDSVQVLASPGPLEPHVDIALLEVDQTEGWNRQGLDYMVQQLREKAAELGCDAVYVKSKSSRHGEEPWLTPSGEQLLATCIVFTPPGAGAVAPLETAGTPKLPARP